MIYSLKQKIKIMVKVYPDINLKNEDVYYSLMKSVSFVSCICVCSIVSLVVLISAVVENDGSY